MKWSDTQSQVSQSQDADCIGATVAYIVFTALFIVGVCMFAMLTQWILR